jgi:hypothetical protein
MDPAAVVDFLAGLGGGGRVLELAIGMGRVPLPLAGRGIAVEGIDASEAMVERLRAKPGGDSIPVVMGDMAQVPATGPSAWYTSSSARCSAFSARPGRLSASATSHACPATE